MDDKELERLAQEELLQEAKRAQKRAEEMGPTGWQRCPLPATNKRFLHNVLVSTLEPRKKKPRQEDTMQPRNQRKRTPRETPFFREKGSKTKSKHEKGEKDRKRSQKNSSHRSSHRRNTDRSPSSQHSSERQTNRID